MLKVTKRVLSLILALCLCLSMVPNMTVQAEEDENIHIFGVDIGVKAGTHMQYSNAYGGISEDGYYYNGVYLYSTQCLGFARWCQYLMFGYHKAAYPERFYPVSANGISSVPRGGLTPEIIKELVLASMPGAHLRTHAAVGDTWGHSMVITEITDEGFSIVQCNGDYNNEYSGFKHNYIGTYTYTWESYVNSSYGKRGIEFIELPYEYPFTEDHEEHTFKGFYYESEHPHKVYQRCFCGERLYTEETTSAAKCEICNPLDHSFQAVLPFKAYITGPDTVYPFTSPQLTELSGGQIQASDECTISVIYENGACEVTYSVDGTYYTAYLPISAFLGDTETELTEQTVNHRTATYMHANTSRAEMYGYIAVGDVIYTVSTGDNMTRLFYHTSSGYKLAWALNSELDDANYASWFDSYGRIHGYPQATADFDVYEADRVTRAGEIWTTDNCTINAVYTDGWCQVTFPVSGGTRTAYTHISNFMDADFPQIRYLANDFVGTFTNQSLSEYIGWLFDGTLFYVVGAKGDAIQVLYPHAEYEGEYQLAWISNAIFPGAPTYTVSYDANDGYGVPESQMKVENTPLTLSTILPTKTGYIFAGWATAENPDVVQYQPGDVFIANMDVTLVAVWISDTIPLFTVGSISGYPGEIVTIPVRISQNPGVVAAKLNIAYDSDALTLIKVIDGGLLGEYDFSNTLTDNPYVVSWENPGAKQDYTDNGNLVYLTFEIKDDASTGSLPVTLSYDAADIYNLAGEQISFAMAAGAVTVVKTDAVALHRYFVEGEAITDYYNDLEQALAVAKSGTIRLLADTTISASFVNSDVVLDLNGKVLSAQTLVAMNGATILDGGEACVGGGLLQIAEDNLIFARNNGQNVLPVWNGIDGYVFTKVTIQQLSRAGATGASQYVFLPSYTNAQASALMADGGSDNGITIKVYLKWHQGVSEQYYTYNDDKIQQVFDGTGRWVFSLNVSGIGGIADMAASAVVISDSGVQVTEKSIPLIKGA